MNKEFEKTNCVSNDGERRDDQSCLIFVKVGAILEGKRPFKISTFWKVSVDKRTNGYFFKQFRFLTFLENYWNISQNHIFNSYQHHTKIFSTWSYTDGILMVFWWSFDGQLTSRALAYLFPTWDAIAKSPIPLEVTNTMQIVLPIRANWSTQDAPKSADIMRCARSGLSYLEPKGLPAELKELSLSRNLRLSDTNPRYEYRGYFLQTGTVR